MGALVQRGEQGTDGVAVRLDGAPEGGGAGHRQYLGIAGSTARAYASMPPVRWRTRVKPSVCIEASACPERTPWWQ